MSRVKCSKGRECMCKRKIMSHCGPNKLCASKSTLNRGYAGKRSDQQIDEKEEKLDRWCKTMSERGFPLSKHKVLNGVKSHLNAKKLPFSKGSRPGDTWYYRFLVLQDQKLKSSKTLEIARTVACNSKSDDDIQGDSENASASHRDIDSIVKKLEQYHQEKVKKSNRRKRKARSLDDRPCNGDDKLSVALPPSSILRDEEKCAALGLRKQVRSVAYYQAVSTSPNPKKRKHMKCISSDDSTEDENEAIDYLLSNSRKRASKARGKVRKSGGETSDSAASSSEVATTSQDESDESSSSSKALKRKINRENFTRVSNKEIELKDICLNCGTTDDVTHSHPLFEGGLCGVHKKMFDEWFCIYDGDGCQSYCSVCCMGDNVVMCDVPDCSRCYCTECLELLVGPGQYKRISSTSNWKCYICSDREERDHFLIKRKDWQEAVKALLTNSQSSQYPSFSVPLPVPPDERKPIRVLSLFDGIATGLIALKQLGLQVDKFIASEIDESAIRLVQNRHPEVIHVGDVTKFSDADVIKHGPFDLVIGGSPCNDLSGANPRRRGLLDAEGTGCLFFDFFRILNAARPSGRSCCKCGCSEEEERPFFWLFENVASMKNIERRRISRFLACEPIVADARMISAAVRRRLFWGNIPGMRQLKLVPGPNDRLDVQSCLEKGRTATVEKLNTITTKYNCLKQGNLKKAPVTHMGKEDVLWSTEVERIFGVPEHYTDVNNLTPRDRLVLLGRSWSVPVIRQLLAPLKEYFAGKKTNSGNGVKR